MTYEHQVILEMRNLNKDKYAELQIWCFDTFGARDNRWDDELLVGSQITNEYFYSHYILTFSFADEGDATFFALKWKQ